MCWSRHHDYGPPRHRVSDDDLYQAAIIAAARAGEQFPRLVEPNATVTLDNPLCGDRVTIDLRTDGDLVIEVGHRVRGCLLCEAASALIARHAPSCRQGELDGLRAKVAAVLQADSKADAEAYAYALGTGWSEVQLFEPVRPHKSRHECVLLPFEVLASALAELGG